MTRSDGRQQEINKIDDGSSNDAQDASVHTDDSRTKMGSRISPPAPGGLRAAPKANCDLPNFVHSVNPHYKFVKTEVLHKEQTSWGPEISGRLIQIQGSDRIRSLFTPDPTDQMLIIILFFIKHLS